MRRPKIVLLVAIVMATLISAACGGDKDAGGVATLGGGAAAAADDGVPEKDFEDALLDYTRCMRKEGIDMPDPEEGEGGAFYVGTPIEVEGGGDGGPMVAAAPAAGAPVPGASMEEFEAADKKCVHLLPESATLTPEEEAEFQDKMLEFARCMREHGVDMPDPTDGMGIVSSIEDLKDPVFKKAQEVCGDILPGSGTTTVEER